MQNLQKNRKAFTMVELVFVIVIIGILSAVAIPKLAATRDDATITKAITTVASVRSAISTERQKRILRGDFTPITSLSDSTVAGAEIFNGFDGDTNNSVLEYPIRSCKAGVTSGCWSVAGTDYTYYMPTGGTAVFSLANNRFNCKVATDKNCQELTK
jgi:general secretion pathway protein G